jgi:hypothetical protein
LLPLLLQQFVTKNGVAEFAYILGTYGYNSPISGDDISSFPLCEGDGNGYYLAVGCSSSGGFTIDRFTDQYCLEYLETYDKLNNFNSVMKNLKCFNCHDAAQGQDVSYSLASYLIADSGSCSASESSLCTTNNFVASAGSGGGFQRASRGFGSASGSFGNQVKYTLGSCMLLGSAAMFFGILFTNRKKRHAMMHRKFRQSTDKKKKKRSSSSKKSSTKKSQKSPGGGVFA